MRKSIQYLMIALLAMMSLSGYALDDKQEKVLNKNREMVEESAPDDWHTLASCAEACMKKNIINKEVTQWLDRSIEIRKTSYNLELKGDYYMMNKLPEKAGDFYLQAIQYGMEEDINFDSSRLQSKLAEIVELDPEARP